MCNSCSFKVYIPKIPLEASIMKMMFLYPYHYFFYKSCWRGYKLFIMQSFNLFVRFSFFVDVMCDQLQLYKIRWSFIPIKSDITYLENSYIHCVRVTFQICSVHNLHLFAYTALSTTCFVSLYLHLKIAFALKYAI